MNPASYFDTAPWSSAVEKMRNGDLGEIKAVAVDSACASGTLQDALRQWRHRLGELFGQPEYEDELRTQAAYSALLCYEGPVLARLFLHEATGEPVDNFELVGASGLLIWKPNVHALSIVRAPNLDDISLQHQYADSLGRNAHR